MLDREAWQLGMNRNGVLYGRLVAVRHLAVASLRKELIANR